MDSLQACPRTDALSARVDDELAATERLALDAHLGACPVCAAKLVELRNLRMRFAALPDPEIGVDLVAGVDQRIGAPSAARKPRVRSKGLHWWQIALAAPGAAAALSVGAYVGSTLMLGARIAAEPAAMQMAAFSATPPGALLCPALHACNGTSR